MGAIQLESIRILVLAEDTVPYESPLLGQHGVSFLLEAKAGEVTKQIIVDVGQNYSALRHNLDSLHVDLKAVDAIVLTHCHYDHTRGIAALLADIGKKDLPVIAHPEIFRLNYVDDPYLLHVGVMQGDDAENIAAQGGRLFLARDPLAIMPGLSTTGEVPRVTDFEEVGINLYTLVDGRSQPDSMPDDISLVANVKGRGLVVVTGCSHAGIVNIVKHAAALYPGERLDGILGGFHLVAASEERIARTVEHLAAFEPRWISSGHCTGFKAHVALSKTFGDRFTPLSSGLEFTVTETAPR